ncbi:MAG TPA: pitrilysin family protein [Alcaligenes faecalis]|nr:pitrilysin family protein [Alcaligenes faecalis]
MKLSVLTVALRLRHLTGAALLSCSLAAYALPAGLAQGPAVEGVTQYTLDNGLRIVLAPDDSKPTTTVNMTYLVGSRHENYGQTGMAHLLEHMLFRGTPTLRNALGEFSKRGLEANGTTSTDRTNYFASFAAQPETLEWYLNWQADVMVNALIDKQDLEAEMPVVRNEMENGENNPFRVLMQKVTAAAFQWHSYGKSTIGARSDVENVDIAQLRKFYHDYYQPDNAVLFVTGQFDTEATLEIIAKSFGSIPKPSRTLRPEYTVEPVQDGTRSVTLRRQGGTPLIMSLYHMPSAASADYIPLSLGVNALGDTPSGQLYKNLVNKKLATSVFSFDSESHDPGYALFGAELKPGMDQQKALQAMNNTLEGLAKTPLASADLERVRSQWMTAWTRTYANPSSLATALSEAAASGDWRLFFLQRDRVETTKLDQVQQALQTWLVASNRTNGLYIPTDKPVRAPEAAPADVQKLLADYKGKDTGKAVEAFDPSPANIDARTDRQPLSLGEHLGEVKMALLPKATRAERVEARLSLKFGTANQLKDQSAVAAAVASLLATGTNKLDREQIADRFTALQTQFSFDGSNGRLQLSLSSTRENLPKAISLGLDILRNATLPEAELQKYQEYMVTDLKSSSTDPTALAQLAIERYSNPWPKGDIRYTPSFEEAIEQVQGLNIKQLRDFHQKFYGAGDLAFSAVGDFDKEQVRQALSEGLKGWRKAPTYQRPDDPFHPVAPKQFDINTPDKANAFYLANLNLKLQDSDADFPAVYVANYLLGLSETSRLWNRIRVQDGLSYNVRSQVDASSYEPNGSWTVYAIHAPNNSARISSTVQEVLEQTLKDGFTEQEVKEGVHALLNYRRLSRSKDSVLSSAWLNYLDLGRTFDWSEQMDKAMQELDAAQVNAALRKYLKPQDLVVAIAADHERQKSDAPATKPQTEAAASAQ